MTLRDIYYIKYYNIKEREEVIDVAIANHRPTKDELKLLDDWVLPIIAVKLGTQITREQFNESYQSWWRGGRGWDRYQMGGTGVSHCIAWYQHVHKPGSKEWRPTIIMRAIMEEAKKWDEIETVSEIIAPGIEENARS